MSSAKFVVMASALLLSGPCFGQAPARSRASVARDLDEVARIASVMIDGDRCGRIMTARALESIARVDPRDPWAASDNFDVHHEPYIQTKKTLIRLGRLLDYPCDVNLWMPLPGERGKIQVLIRNANEWSQFWTWGKLVQDLPPEMKRVLEGGARETVTARPPFISVLAPVYDSLGDVVGLVEAVSIDPASAAPEVHARAPVGPGFSPEAVCGRYAGQLELYGADLKTSGLKPGPTCFTGRAGRSTVGQPLQPGPRMGTAKERASTSAMAPTRLGRADSVVGTIRTGSR